MTDSLQTADIARTIAAAVVGRDPGPITRMASDSHVVYISADVVVKIIDGSGHSRLDREIALASHLPIGLSAPLLASGRYHLGSGDVRYACYARVPGTSPGMGMRGVDELNARLLAEDAVQRLEELHNWIPTGNAEEILREPLNHGGFVSQATLLAGIETLASIDRDGLIPSHLLSGLKVIAKRAPMRANVDVPIHADCHWGNWLTNGQKVMALLDFEWARFGEPIDDWFFLARFSGPNMDTVLDVVTSATQTPSETLRAGCEIREAAHIISDLSIALRHRRASDRMTFERLRDLEALITEHIWWGYTN